MWHLIRRLTTRSHNLSFHLFNYILLPCTELKRLIVYLHSKPVTYIVFFRHQLVHVHAICLFVNFPRIAEVIYQLLLMHPAFLLCSIQLKKELDAFDPAFFEEIEDLKYNYQEAVKKNIQYEEQLVALAKQFGVSVPGLEL